MSHCSDVVEDATKKTPHRCASGSFPSSLFPNPSSSSPSVFSSFFPAAYLSTRHKHICKSIRGQARKGHMGVGSRMLLRIQAVRDMCWEGRGKEGGRA